MEPFRRLMTACATLRRRMDTQGAGHSGWGSGAESPRLRICFYAAVKDRRLFDVVEFYRQDMRALRDLGHDVVCVNRPAGLRGRYDVFWVWWPTSGMPAVAWGRLRGRPVVLVTAISDRDTTASGMGSKRAAAKLAARLSLATANLTLASSFDTAAGLAAYRVRRLRVARLGVDTAFYRPGDAQVGEPYVVTVSHLTPDNVSRKRILDVVRTAAVLRDRAIPCRFVIIGDDRQAGADLVRAEIARLAVPDLVSLTGRLEAEDKRRLIAGARVYFQPTQYEAFGLAIAEAMACGVRVLTTAVGAVPEVVAQTGTLLPSQAGPPEFASQLIALMGRPAGSVAARERVLEHFSYEARRRSVAAALTMVRSPGAQPAAARQGETELRRVERGAGSATANRLGARTTRRRETR